MHGFNQASAGQHQALFLLVQWVLALPLYLVTAFALPLYLLDCLYAERKDRSILFWKSLPVSDGLTIAAKLLVALLIVPLGVFLLAIVTHIVVTGIWDLRVLIGNAPAGVLVWDSLTWVKLETNMLLALVLAVLWYAPLAAALLLVSAWARRMPLLWAVLPPLVAPLLERIAFGTTYLWHFLFYRCFGIWGFVGAEAAQWAKHSHGEAPAELLDHLNFGAAFGNIDLWLGLVVAAALVFAAIRVRRYRDDT
jgi:ABC-2 type transport system permease protein